MTLNGRAGSAYCRTGSAALTDPPPRLRPLSTRYSFGTLRRLDQHGSGSTFSRLVRKVVVLLALLINALIIFMVVAYGLIVIFSILNGGPIVATGGLQVLVSRG